MVPSEDDEFLREVWQEVGTTCTKPCGITVANAWCSRLLSVHAAGSCVARSVTSKSDGAS